MRGTSGPYGIIVGGIDGWPDYYFANVEVELINGRPALVGFRLVRAEGATPTPLTARRLGGIPAFTIAKTAGPLFGLNPEPNAVFAGMADALDRYPVLDRPRGGSDDFHRAILRIKTIARAEGESAIQKIMDATGVKRDRAKQYSADAETWASKQQVAESAK